MLAGGVLEQSNRIFTASEARRWCWFTPPAKTKSLQSSARVGRLAPWTWIGTSPETRLSWGKGLDPAVVPGAVHAALTVLERWGTMSFEEVARPAIEYAEEGFPLRPSTTRAIGNQLTFFERWPDKPGVLVQTRRVPVQGR